MSQSPKDHDHAPLDAAFVRDLASILAESGLTEIEIERGDLKLRLAKAATIVHAAPAAMAMAPAPVAAAALLQAPSAPAAAAPESPRDRAGAVTSPMVGTAYLSPEPGAAAFVKQGDTVAEGQTLMIVEAMKTFNPIPSPRAGKVEEILVRDGQPVEFGEALMVIR